MAIQSSLLEHGFICRLDTTAPPIDRTTSHHLKLPDEIWRHIFTFVDSAKRSSATTQTGKRAMPRHPDLTVLMRVSMRFQVITAPLLYHTCHADAPDRFFYGINDPPTSKRLHKLDLLRFVRRLELSHRGVVSNVNAMDRLIELHGLDGVAEVLEGKDEISCYRAMADLAQLKYDRRKQGQSDVSLMPNLALIRIGSYDDRTWQWWVAALHHRAIDPALGYISPIPGGNFWDEMDPIPASDVIGFTTSTQGPRPLSMYHRHVARHPNQWGLIYPILDLISENSFQKTICQSGVAGPLSLGSIPVSLADNHFSYLYDKPPSASAGLYNLRVVFHININGQGRLLSPYSPVVPGAANLWYVEYDQVWDEWEINHWDDTLDWRANLHHCIPVQDAIIQFSHSMHANANTTLTIYSLNDSAHVKARKDAVHSNRPDLRHSIETLCGKKEPWMKDLSKITTPRRFGPFNMYRISTQQGIELMDVVVGGLKVRFKDFSPDDGDEACPACKGDR